METRLLFALLALAIAAGAFAEAYTWTDEDGVVHYSDKPHPGATVVDLGESSRPNLPPRRIQNDGATSNDGTTAAPATGYESIDISSPAAEETLWNIGATLNVSISLNPALQPGHQVRAYFDGEPRMVAGTNFQIQEVFRGVHNLQVEVIDENGQLVIRSRPNRFYVQQNTIL